MKKHTITYWGKNAPKAYVSNGFIGFRFGKNAFEDSFALLNGFTTIRENRVEGLAVVPAPRLTFLYNGVTVAPQIKAQSYDFANGEFSTEAIVDCGGTPVEVTYMVYCSRTSPTLLVSSVCAKGDCAGKLMLRTTYEIPETHKHTVSDMIVSQYFDDSFDCKCHVISADRTTSAGVSYALFGTFSEKLYDESNRMTTEAALDTKDGDPLYIVTSYVPSLMHKEPHNQAQRMLALAGWVGMEDLRENNRLAWKELWRSRIEIEGAQPEWQNVIDASFFYLMSSSSPFSPMSVPPFGLSHPDMYDGHCFWDTESFMIMPSLFIDPRIARTMLNYRFRRLEDAEHNARLNGYMGIQFPWQSGVSGSELTPPEVSHAGEQHVNLDVALAFDGYARIHGDEAYIKEVVWPVVRGVCEWIESRVIKTDRGYEIHHVIGIEEADDNVNNDSYINLMSAKLLRSGSEYSVMMGLGVRRKWLEIADQMFIPFRPTDGVLKEHENMPEREEQSSVTLMSYFPYGYTNGAQSDRITMDYYITHGMKEYCHYPMLSGFLGVYPAWIGDRETSLMMYELANLTFFCEPFYSCTEFSIPTSEDRIDPKEPLDTNFITGRGSLLSGLIMGLTKICPWRGAVDAPIEKWIGENIVLPAGWTKITIGRVFIRGKEYRIEAEHGAKRAVLIEL